MDDMVIKTDTSFRRTTPVKTAGSVNLNNQQVEERAAKREEESEAKNEKAKNVNSAELAEKANKHVEAFSTKIAFNYDSERQQSMILVTDKETGKVIRQIPAEEMLDLMDKMEEIAGIIFNGRA